MNIVLIGYRGTGKSTIGPLVAARLARPFIDADEQLERRAGRSIREIFAADGEEAFRDLETAVLDDLLAGGDRVIALGGGAVLRQGNRRRIQSPNNHVVWLQAGVDAIEQRMATDAATAERRPNLTASGGREEIVRLLGERTPLYRECAEFVVDTEGRTADQIAAEVVSLVTASR